MSDAGYDRTFSADRRHPSQRPAAAPTGRTAPASAAHARRTGGCRGRPHDLDGGRSPLGCSLDLGSTTKAWAADASPADLVDRLEVGVLVDLGGDVVAAGHAPAAGWLVQVVDGPMSHRVGTTRAHRRRGARHIEHGGAAGGCRTASSGTTSSTRAPGSPSDDLWRTVTVSAASCLDANVASTACVVLGAEDRVGSARSACPLGSSGATASSLALNGWPDDGPVFAATAAPKRGWR